MQKILIVIIILRNKEDYGISIEIKSMMMLIKIMLVRIIKDSQRFDESVSS